RSGKDIALAKLINQQIQDRSQQFAVATGNIDPNAAAAIAANQTPSQPAMVRAAAPVKLTPDPGAPNIGQLSPQEQVTASPGRNGYAFVQTASGQQGYVSASDLQGGGGGRRSISVPTAGSAAGSGDMRTLAGSNAARRDDFAQSVSVAEKAQG